MLVFTLATCEPLEEVVKNASSPDSSLGDPDSVGEEWNWGIILTSLLRNFNQQPALTTTELMY